jgi:hypothetical protein
MHAKARLPRAGTVARWLKPKRPWCRKYVSTFRSHAHDPAAARIATLLDAHWSNQQIALDTGASRYSVALARPRRYGMAASIERSRPRPKGEK